MINQEQKRESKKASYYIIEQKGIVRVSNIAVREL